MDKEHKCNAVDELVAGPEINGVRPFIRHTSDHRIFGGVMKTAKDGQPVNGSELVQLTNIEGNRYKVESLYGSQDSDHVECDCSGPSKVVSDKYRYGWDRIFGKEEIGQA